VGCGRLGRLNHRKVGCVYGGQVGSGYSLYRAMCVEKRWWQSSTSSAALPKKQRK
jgi:hypothetical protein